MNVENSKPKRRNFSRWLKSSLCLWILLSMLGVQQAVARPQDSFFFSNMFNISPGTSTSSQEYCDVAYNLDRDEWLVAWEDDRSGTDTGIYGRRVGKDGNLVGNELNFKDNADTLRNPAAAYDDYRERYLVVWENWSLNDIEGRVLNADGTWFNAAFTVYDCAHGCGNPDVVYNPLRNEYLVVWELLDGAGFYDVYGQRVSESGSPSGSEYLIAGGPANTHQSDPAVAVNPSSGRYLVVFMRNNTGDYNIAGRRLNNDGSVAGNAFAISTTTDDERTPDVVIRPSNGRAYVVWEHDLGGTGVNIEGTIVNDDNTRGSVVTVGDVGTNDVWPSVTYAPPYEQFLVAWSTTLHYDIYGRYVNPDNTLASTEFQITDDSIDQWRPKVAFGRERYLAIFENYTPPQDDIYGRLGADRCLYLPIIRN